MKLLLTSAGISNKIILNALENLHGKSLKDTKLAFIPTASQIESGDKGWLIKDLNNFQNAGFLVDIVDISAVKKDIWLPRLEEAEVLVCGGGNTFHLMYWLKKSGLQKLLPALLEKRIYVGISAGSCVAGPTIYNSVQNLFGETYELIIKKGLHLVPFQIIPHLNSPYFTKIRKEYIQAASIHMKEPIYAIDDNSAISIHDNEINIASEGEWLCIQH